MTEGDIVYFFDADCTLLPGMLRLIKDIFEDNPDYSFVYSAYRFNAEGLNILRIESPYANQIASLSQDFKNVKFLACGMAKQNAMFRENKTIKLLPQATDIPAALDRIVNRLQDGWTYLRG